MAVRVSHDNTRTPNSHIHGSWRFKHNQQSETPRERAGEGNKSAKPHPSGLHHDTHQNGLAQIGLAKIGRAKTQMAKMDWLELDWPKLVKSGWPKRDWPKSVSSLPQGDLLPPQGARATLANSYFGQPLELFWTISCNDDPEGLGLPKGGAPKRLSGCRVKPRRHWGRRRFTRQPQNSKRAH